MSSRFLLNTLLICAGIADLAVPTHPTTPGPPSNAVLVPPVQPWTHPGAMTKSSWKPAGLKKRWLQGVANRSSTTAATCEGLSVSVFVVDRQPHRLHVCRSTALPCWRYHSQLAERHPALLEHAIHFQLDHVVGVGYTCHQLVRLNPLCHRCSPRPHEALVNS